MKGAVSETGPPEVSFRGHFTLLYRGLLAHLGGQFEKTASKSQFWGREVHGSTESNKWSIVQGILHVHAVIGFAKAEPTSTLYEMTIGNRRFFFRVHVPQTTLQYTDVHQHTLTYTSVGQCKQAHISVLQCTQMNANRRYRYTTYTPGCFTSVWNVKLP